MEIWILFIMIVSHDKARYATFEHPNKSSCKQAEQLLDKTAAKYKKKILSVCYKK